MLTRRTAFFGLGILAMPAVIPVTSLMRLSRKSGELLRVTVIPHKYHLTITLEPQQDGSFTAKVIQIVEVSEGGRSARLVETMPAWRQPDYF